MRFVSAAVVAASLALAATPRGQTQGLGHISFPTSGAAAAQPAFVRGVLLLHSFQYDDAIEAFRDAERLDPGFAMAYWGEALSFDQPLWGNENVAKARAALQRLAPTPTARAAKAPTAREKGYLDAVERLFGDGDRHTRVLAYADRMRQLAHDYPNDDEAASLYALALLATIPPGTRDPAISLKAGAIASAVLAHNPEHPGAAHYILHAYDDGEHAALGLKAARLYARIAPGSSHARHMPSHIFLPLGMWDDAARSDEAAFAASVDWAKRKGVSVAQEDFHSLSWLQYEYLQQGRFAKALGTLEPVRQALADLQRPGAAPGGPMAQHVESEIGRGFGPMSLQSEVASMRARYVVESGDWASMKGQGSFGNVDELCALGLASVHLGDFARADAAIKQLGGAVKAAPDADAKAVTAIMQGEVIGLLQIAMGERADGLATLAHAAQLEGGRPKPIARPYPIKPAGELYAEALLQGGDAERAMQQFQAALTRTPRRAASLIGLARAAQKAGRRAEATRAAREFIAMWHLADAGRPEIADARAMLTSR